MKKKDASILLLRLAKLRQEYQVWKRSHEDRQDEGFINKFLILKHSLGQDFLPIKSSLDSDASSFLKMAEGSSQEGSNLAPVRSSGHVIGDPISLQDYLPYLKDFVIASPVSWIVGGLCSHDCTKGDADFLYMVPDKEELSRIVDFRIFRMLPEELAKRVHALWEDRGARSPFTNCLPLYRLKMERVPDVEIVKMAEDRKGPFSLKLRVKNDSKSYDQAEKAWRHDRITPGEFYHAAKPVRGYYSGQPQSIELFLKIWNSNFEFPSLSSKKYDGEHCLISKLPNKKVTVFSEDGSLLSKLPNLKKEVAALKAEKLVIEAETENWNYSKGQHFPRESVNTNIDDDHFTSNVFDCLYFKGEVPNFLYQELQAYDKSPELWKKQFGHIPKSSWVSELTKGEGAHRIDLDIHKYPCLTRFRLMHLLGIIQMTVHAPKEEFRLNLVEHFRDEDDTGLRKRTEFLRKLVGSEGNVCSAGFRSYTLTSGPRPYQMLKFHNSSQFHAVVLKPIETKTKGIFNLEYGIFTGNRKVNEKNLRVLNGQTVVYTGKTFATTDKVPRGGIITIECETLNVIFDMLSGTFDVSAWAPRYMGRYKGQPDDINSAENRAIKDHCFQAKIIGVDGSISYLPGHSGEELRSK